MGTWPSVPKLNNLGNDGPDVVLERGKINGQYEIGNCYLNGIGTTKDEKKAFQWYLKSAEGGDSGAHLGLLYEEGVGTTKDHRKAFQWYFKSAEGGYSSGQYNLGNCYLNGIGTTNDEKKAFQCFLKSAKGGDSHGQCSLGNCYLNGIGIAKDEVKAFQWYLKSAEGGNSHGQYCLGYCSLNEIGTKKDEEKAFQDLKSAGGGGINGQYEIGNCYLNGIGTTKDEKKAFQWYLKSAEGGKINGQYEIGNCYLNGIGTTKDEKKAFQWYLKSAEGGSLNGKVELGNCYSNGIGTTEDKEKAVLWYLKAAEGRNYHQQVIDYFYRQEIQVSTIKKYQNKLQNFIRKDISLALSKSSIKKKSSVEDFNVNIHNCCICWQTNGCIEICKKNFQDFSRCHNCGNLNIRKNVCKDCKGLELKYMIIFSGDDNIIANAIVQTTELNENTNELEIWRWIDYSKLRDIRYLDKGGFGTIWKAEWTDMPEDLFDIYNSNQVALKKLANSEIMHQEFLNELLANFDCRSKYVLPILGLTQDPMTMKYALVLRYMKNGNLRNFLQQNKTLSWIERLWLLDSFISGLEHVHGKGYIHCDLHPGNLMITEAYDNVKFIRLGDLGLCKTCWNYYVGNINRAYDLELTLEILEGLRPNIKEGTPQCYIELMKKCWNKDPSKRPSTKIINDILNKWTNQLTFNVQTESSLMFLNADQEMKNEDFQASELSIDEPIHSEASLISKILPSIQYSNFNLSNIDWNDL
ncbi:hypothetical protein Glove_151g16 [Diversispora epigaea]|uniref:Protein kinase domain-containing protein n=1 Tax=Diversispora epigaea TaxID=1348612 RepID=A0A397J276_9GLOM|nr:hypothetical protein Glove_151g16 [Diversispora epigaea]